MFGGKAIFATVQPQLARGEGAGQTHVLLTIVETLANLEAWARTAIDNTVTMDSRSPTHVMLKMESCTIKLRVGRRSLSIVRLERAR